MVDTVDTATNIKEGSLEGVVITELSPLLASRVATEITGLATVA